MSIVVYGKPNCTNCTVIQKKLIDIGVEFEYIKDEELLMGKARALHSEGKLIETTAPLVLKDGVQIRHKDIKELL